MFLCRKDFLESVLRRISHSKAFSWAVLSERWFLSENISEDSSPRNFLNLSEQKIPENHREISGKGLEFSLRRCLLRKNFSQRSPLRETFPCQDDFSERIFLQRSHFLNFLKGIPWKASFHGKTARRFRPKLSRAFRRNFAAKRAALLPNFGFSGWIFFKAAWWIFDQFWKTVVISVGEKKLLPLKIGQKSLHK